MHHTTKRSYLHPVDDVEEVHEAIIGALLQDDHPQFIPTTDKHGLKIKRSDLCLSLEMLTVLLYKLQALNATTY